MDSLGICRDILKTYIELNVENQLERSEVMTNLHLIEAKEATEEELFFELLNSISTDDQADSHSQLTNVSSRVRKSLLAGNKAMIQREAEVFGRIKENI